MKRAKRGFFSGSAEGAEDGAAGEDACASVDARSVFSVIRVSVEIFGERFVNHGLTDHVFLAGPSAEVEQFAALAAEWELCVRVRVSRLLANWAVEFHVVPAASAARLQGLKPLKKTS